MSRFGKRSAFAAIVAGLFGAGYMLFEAQWLKVRSRRLVLSGLPPGLKGLRLLHISDLHAGAPGPTGRAIRKAVRAAGALQPDVILFTGDMTDKMKDLSPWLPLLAELRAPLGIFAVLGNHDHGLRKTVIEDLIRRLTGGSPAPGKFEVAAAPHEETVDRNRRLLAWAGIRLLQNECASLAFRSEALQICGADDYQYGYADLPAIDAQTDHMSSLRILLSHSPDIIGEPAAAAFQLLLAGHTHGGQICLPRPAGGKILLSTSGSCYGAGLYEVSGVTMHISPGVGTTLLPFRLLSRPEITLLELA